MCFLLRYCKSLGLECQNKAVGPSPGLEGLFIRLPNITQCPRCCFCGGGNASGRGGWWSVALGSRQFRMVAESQLTFHCAKLFPTWSSLQLHQLLSLLCTLLFILLGFTCLLNQQNCPLFSFNPPRLIFCHFTKLGYCIEMPALNPEEWRQSVVGEKKQGEARSSYLAVMSCLLGSCYLLKLLKHK